MQENPTVPGSEFAGRYTIERELGRGGAAIVYLARDNRQERQVALKVLHRELAAAIGAQRFLREIKHSSALHHPHLLSIHDSGEADGLLYFVMPYMADGSLRARITKEKQLPIDDALRITRQVGEALSYAHSRGIVHRDIKPDNVLFSADHACLADFGIARAVDSAAADTLTSTGLVVGTPAYMSPEQASGEKRVDTRSDQYSLACLLYEMITGLPPFIGATQQAVISQRFTQPPPSMRAHRPSVPDHVERAVKRALAIVPADRFSTVQDFISALHDPGAVPKPVSVHAIRRRWFAVGAVAAVVVLAVVAAKPGAEWMRGAFGTQVDTSKFVVLPFLSDADSTDGIRVATAIHEGLARWRDLPLENHLTVSDAVRERGSISSLDDAYSIAEELGAGKLVWGNVSRDGGRTTLHAELYDVATRKGISRERLSVQGEGIVDTLVYGMVSSLIAVDAVPDGMDGGERGTNSYGAWQAYRRGIAAAGQVDLDRARVELARAIELDPDFAVAHLEWARAQSWLQEPQDAPIWRASAMRAVALKEELRSRDAKRAAALLAFSQKDYASACRHFAELIAADTLDARAWYDRGMCLHADNTVQRDPRSPSGFSFRASWHSAGEAFVRAMNIEAPLHALAQRRRLGQVLPTSHNQIRSGVLFDSDEIWFGAIPQLIADTLAFIPYRRPDFERDVEEAAQRRREALARNRNVIRELTSSWIQAFPRSSDAHAAMASILEQQGELVGAIRSLATARRLEKRDQQRLSLAEAEARVSYKNGDFARARQIADSTLADFRETTESNWEPVARLAGMTGAVSRLAEALQFFWQKYVDVEDLDQAVYKAAGRALARAAVGLCDGGPLAVERQLNSIVQVHVPPGRHVEVRSKVVGQILSFSTPCARGTGLGAIAAQQPVERAQVAFSGGDTARARAILDSIIVDRAHLRAAEISPAVVAREAFLRLALGDSGAALALINGTLNGLGTIPASTMQHPLESATLVRLMVTRAELAAKTGDRRTARKWAQAVAVLWADADSEARPIRNRMMQLAASGP